MIVLDFNELFDEREHIVETVNSIIKQHGTVKLVNVPHEHSFSQAMSLLEGFETFAHLFIPNPIYKILYISSSMNEIVLTASDNEIAEEELTPPIIERPPAEVVEIPHQPKVPEKHKICEHITGKSGAGALGNLSHYMYGEAGPTLQRMMDEWVEKANPYVSQRWAGDVRLGSRKFINIGCVVSSYMIASGMTKLLDKKNVPKQIKQVLKKLYASKATEGPNTKPKAIATLGKEYSKQDVFMPYEVGEFVTKLVPRWPAVVNSFLIKPGSMGFRSLTALAYNTLTGSMPMERVKLAALLMTISLLVPKAHSYFKSKVIDLETFNRKFNLLPIKSDLTKIKQKGTVNLGVLPYFQIILRKSEQYGIPADLIAAVMDQESQFNPKCKGTSGEFGLMQLMPGTANLLGVKDPWDPEQNIDGGVRYMRDNAKRYPNNLDLQLASYNGGPGRAETLLRTSSQVQGYVASVKRKIPKYTTMFQRQSPVTLTFPEAINDVLSVLANSFLQISLESSPTFKEIVTFIFEHYFLIEDFVMQRKTAKEVLNNLIEQLKLYLDKELIPFAETIYDLMVIKNEKPLYSTVTLGKKDGNLCNHMVAMPRKLIFELPGIQNVGYSSCGSAIEESKDGEKVLLPVHLIGSSDWRNRFLRITGHVVTGERNVWLRSDYQIVTQLLQKITGRTKSITDLKKLIRLSF